MCALHSLHVLLEFSHELFDFLTVSPSVLVNLLLEIFLHLRELLVFELVHLSVFFAPSVVQLGVDFFQLLNLHV